jgi:hypothetical protein
LRLVLKRYLLLTSAVLLAAAGSPVLSFGRPPNHTSLCGLRPGLSTEAQARKKFPYAKALPGFDPDNLVDAMPCIDYWIEIHFDSREVVDKLSLKYDPGVPGDCSGHSSRWWLENHYGTAQGLVIGDSCEDAEWIYGKPESESVDAQSNPDIKTMTYDFGWAGQKVPEVLQIQCSGSTNKVVKMTLSKS